MGLFNCSIEFDKSRKLWLEVALTSYDRYLCSKNRRFQVEAANCMKKADPMKATLLYDKVIQTYSEDGRFSQAGKLLKQVAEMLKEERVEDDDRVLDYYMRACDMFEMDDFGKSNYTNCNLKVAEFLSKKSEWRKAIDIYETEGRKCLSNNMRQHSRVY